MATPFLGFENDVENTLQPGAAFNQLADAMDAAIAGFVEVNFTTDAALTLTRDQWMTAVLVLTDTGPVLTGGVDVTFPAAFPSMLVVNDTAQTLTLTNGATDEVTLDSTESVHIAAGPAGVLANSAGGGGGSVSWGAIGGTLADQTDLQAALDAKAANRNIVTTVSSSSGTTALDASLGDYFKSSLTENTTIALSNVPAGCTLHLQLTQHASTGPYTVAFPAGWDWGEGNTAPTMPTGAGKIMDVIVTSNDSGATGIASWRVRA